MFEDATGIYNDLSLEISNGVFLPQCFWLWVEIELPVSPPPPTTTTTTTTTGTKQQVHDKACLPSPTTKITSSIEGLIAQVHFLPPLRCRIELSEQGRQWIIIHFLLHQVQGSNFEVRVP